MLQIKVTDNELKMLFLGVEHEIFQKALKANWIYDKKTQQVKAQSVCWLFCWAKTGLNKQLAMEQSREVFDQIFVDMSFKKFDGLVEHEWARKARWKRRNIESELDGLLYPKVLDHGEFAKQVERSQKSTPKERKKRLKKANPHAAVVIRKVKTYQRNPDVVAEALILAKGKCQRCGKNAPFIRKSDNSPYLEVHHKKTLAKGGLDTVGNTIALCPNCHRKAHFGV